jgi:hypothetical protein
MEQVNRGNIKELEELFLTVFKSVKFDNNLLTVSDGTNKQTFCLDINILKMFDNKFDKSKAEDLLDTIQLNFRHVFDDES